MHLPKVIAHRGASGYAPENTLSAFREAKERGATWVEFDVQLTADGVPVVFHDDELSRTTNGKGLLAQTTWSDLQKLDAGSWFGVAFNHAHIPALEQVLACLLEENLAMNLEIKPSHGQALPTVQAVLATLKKHWPDSAPAPLLSSFDMESLRWLTAMHSPHSVGMLMHEWKSNWLSFAKTLDHCVSINVNQDVLNAQRVADIKREGYGLLSYTVNDQVRAEQLFAWGVDGVFTDFPDSIK